MKRLTFFLLGLGAVGLIVAYLWIQPTDRKEETYQLPDVKLALDISKIVRIEIERKGKHIHMEHTGNTWKVIEPVNFVMDDEAIYRLLEGMAKFKLINLVSSNPQKYGTFAVDDSGTDVTVTYDDGTNVNIVVGKSGPTPNQTYVRPVSLKAVYLARGLTATTVNKELRDWRQRTIYHIDPSTIKLFKIQSDTQKFLIQRKGKQWYANNKAISRRSITPALTALSYVRADDFIDTPLVISTPPELHIELMTPNLLVMDIYAREHSHSKHFLKTSLSSTIFAVGDTLVENLKILAQQLGVPVTTPSEDTAAVALVLPAFRPAPTDTELTESARQVLSSLATLQSLRLTPTQSTEENQGELIIYTVERGQKLTDIAKKYKVTVDQLRTWNLLKTDTISKGMELYIFLKRK